MRYDPETHEPNITPHEGQERITLTSGDSFMADTNLVPLLKAMDEAGLKTYSHCAGHDVGHGAWIVLDLDETFIEVRPARVSATGAEVKAQIILGWQPTWNREGG